MDIVPEDVIFVLSVLVGNDLVKVVASKDDVSDLSIGDQVLVASKAFNPVIKKILEM